MVLNILLMILLLIIFEMKQLKEFIKTISDSYLPVMIYGETGTGKELFAQAIHNESKRKDKPFIAQTVQLYLKSS